MTEIGPMRESASRDTRRRVRPGSRRGFDGRQDDLVEIGFESAPSEKAKAGGLPAYAFWPVALTLSLFVISSYMSNLAFPLVASLGGLLCLGYWRYARAFAAPLITLVALMAWGALNSPPQVLANAFTSFDAFSKTQWAKTFGQLLLLPPLVLAAWRMPAREAHWLFSGLKWAMAALAALLLVETFTGAAVYQWLSVRIYQPIRPDLAYVKTSLPTYQLVWMIWPVLMVAALKGGHRLLWLMIACVAIAPVMMSANAVTLGLIGSAIVFFAARAWPKSWGGPEHSVAMGFASLIVLFPSLIAIMGGLGVIDKIQPHLPASWEARTEIWQDAAARMFQWPIEGWGFDYSRYFKDIPLHPHNVALQAGLELGFVGVILVALLWAQAAVRIGKPYPPVEAAEDDEDEDVSEASEDDDADEAALQPFGNDQADIQARALDTRPYMLAAMTPFFVFQFMSFGMWQEWFVAMAAIMACVCLLACRSLEYDA